MTRAAPRWHYTVSALALELASCAGNGSQSALDSAGPQAGRIEDLWWLFFWVCTAVYVVVMVALVAGLRRGSFRLRDVVLSQSPDDDRRRTRGVGIAVIITAFIIVALTVASYLTDRALATAGTGDSDAIRIELTGHQWWWEVIYDDPTPSRRVSTANEIHIPVGRTIAMTLRATDVIHTFWVPNLHGKQDLIPGRTNEIRFRADRIGTFRGQCAEFCGAQHANMALLMKVESADDFERWRSSQVAPAARPSNDEQQRGRDAFLSSSCVLCHAIRGTPAGGKVAPDLTHVASRETLAAGTIPNTPGHMAAWIVDPQRIKEGAHMPTTGIQPEDLQALLAYLRSLT